METTNSTVIQIESVVVENKFIANVKKAIKRAFRPQWKKWKDSFDISRFVEAMWMQQVKKQELSPANYEQLCALEREIQVTKEVARYCFTKKVENVRTKQLCGHSLTKKQEVEAFNYAVENHFYFLRSSLTKGEDRCFSRTREEAIKRARKNAPEVKVWATVLLDANTSVDLLRLEGYGRKLERQLAVPSQAMMQDPDFASLRYNWQQLNRRNAQNDAALIETKLEEICYNFKAIDAMSKATEIIEVAAKTLPTETVVVNTTPSTDAEPSAIANKKTSINKLTIKELKSYAKRHKIYIPGKVTKVKQMKEIVIVAQNGSTKIRD